MLFAQDLIAETGTSLLQPSAALGAEMHPGACKERFESLHSLYYILQGAWVSKLVLELEVYSRVVLQQRDEADMEKPVCKPQSRLSLAALRGSAQYPRKVSSALSHRPWVSPGVPRGNCRSLHPASQQWAAQELAFSAALCIPAVMLMLERSPFLCFLETGPQAKPMAHLASEIFLCSGEQRDGEILQSCLPHSGNEGCSHPKGMYCPKQFCF